MLQLFGKALVDAAAYWMNAALSQLRRSRDVLPTPVGSEVTAQCVLWFSQVFSLFFGLGGISLLRSTGSCFFMVVCKSFGSLLLMLFVNFVG